MRCFFSAFIIFSAFAATSNCAAADSTGSSDDVRSADLPHTNTNFEPAGYERLQDWQARRRWLSDQVRLAARLIPEPRRNPLHAEIFGKLQRDGYTVEKVFFASAPGLYVTGNLYRPAQTAGRLPAVACPHGHWANGRLHHDERGSVPARCITLARNGAVAFAYDMLGVNDSGRAFQHRDARLETPEAPLWGIGHLPLQTFNSIRVIDFLQSLPDVDAERIAVTGASGGGTQTFILGAVDERVRIDCPVNMISSTMQGGCVCENAPLLRIGTNNMEIAALFAPRPRLMVSATGDWTKLTPELEYPFVRGIYELYGLSERIANVHVDAPHNYNLESRQAMYRFFGKWLLNIAEPDKIDEGHIPVEKPEDLLVFDDSNLPADLAGPEQLIELWQQRSNQAMADYRPTTASKLDDLARMIGLWLQHATGSSEDPSDSNINVVSAKPPENSGSAVRIEETRQRNGRTVSSLTLVGTNSGRAPLRSNLVIIVDPDGLAAADKHKGLVDALLASGQRVTFLEPFGTGVNRRKPAATQPADTHKFFTTFNPTDDAETVHDIVTGLYPLAASDPLIKGASGLGTRIRLVGFGRMGPLCLASRAMLPESLARRWNLRVIADLNGMDWNQDETYVKQMFIPMVRHFGGLPAISATAAQGSVWVHNTAGKFDASWLEQASRSSRASVRVDEQAAEIKEMVEWVNEVR